MPKKPQDAALDAAAATPAIDTFADDGTCLNCGHKPVQFNANVPHHILQDGRFAVSSGILTVRKGDVIYDPSVIQFLHNEGVLMTPVLTV